MARGFSLLIVYASRTGNVRRFVQQIPLPRLEIITGDERVEEPCILITYTTGFGQIPAEVERFARGHLHQIRGVAASGNRNWGSSFAAAAERLAERYGLPVLHKFELSGSHKDVEKILKGVRDAQPRAQ